MNFQAIPILEEESLSENLQTENMLDWIKQGMKEDYSEIVDNMALTLHGSITNSVQNFLSKTDP